MLREIKFHQIVIWRVSVIAKQKIRTTLWHEQEEPMLTNRSAPKWPTHVGSEADSREQGTTTVLVPTTTVRMINDCAVWASFMRL
jgi:hypothetical protein